MQPRSKNTAQQGLQQQVAEFLAAGGKIQGVDKDATGEGPKRWCWNASHYPSLKKKTRPQ